MIGKKKTGKREYFVVVGLGTFGRTVARELIKRGCQITAIDKDEKVVEEASEFAIDVTIADVRDKKPLEEAGASSADVAIVSIGEDLEASFLATLHLKELGVPWIVTKASSASQGEILKKIGADRVIYPEEEMAQKLAEQLLNPNIINYLQLNDEVGILESQTPDSFIGKTPRGLSLRNKYKLNLIAIKRKTEKKGEEVEELLEVPSPDEEIKEGDVLLVIGDRKSLERFKKFQRTGNEEEKK
ncbi:MAG: TrkA family potassium uptake protein [candidate division WOR-3 bacterium]|nr:TrkA family potassium uptake protein [candidate division WOR-3 bacterium]